MKIKTELEENLLAQLKFERGRAAADLHVATEAKSFCGEQLQTSWKEEKPKNTPCGPRGV